MLQPSAENLPTPAISATVVRDLIRHRNSYSYPKAYIVACQAADSNLVVGEIHARYVHPVDGAITDSWLDSYHHQLLHSEIAGERLLGLASVLFWGFYTFGANYSINRVQWLLNGKGRFGPTTIQLASERTDAANNELIVGNVSGALSNLYGISQLNQTPFASKVVAFMAPSIAGVLDNRISDGLQEQAWANNLSCNIGPVNSVNQARGYQSWCQWLSLVASQINLGIEFGRDWQWTGVEGAANAWRAIDVERALFSMYAD